MKSAFVIFFFLFSSSIIFTQTTYTWDDGGADSSWFTVENWSPDGLPGALDTVVISINAEITGDSPTTIGTLNIEDTVSLDLDLSIGDGTIPNHGIIISAHSSLTLLGGTYNISPASNKNGINIFAGADTAALVIDTMATVNITGGSHGMNLANEFSTMTVNGSLNITGVANDGIRISDGTFVNTGVINTETAGTGNQSSDNAIDISGELINYGDIYVDGGTESKPRAINVVGTLSNYGYLNVSGGNENRSISIEGGMVDNYPCSYIDLTDTRVVLNGGSLLNEGYLETDSTLLFFASGGGTATNTGFYELNDGNEWTADNGLEVTTDTLSFDLEGGCTFDINGDSTGMTQYFWESSVTTFDTNTVDGEIDVSYAGFTDQSGPHYITLANDGCSAYDTLFTVEVNNVCSDATMVLPIDLISFSATRMDAGVLLEWKTAIEINNDFMAVEKSKDGRKFREIGRVSGAGNSNEILAYHLVDDNPLPGMNYYRLRQVDYDGTETLSDAVYVDFGESNQVTRFFPSVTNNLLYIRLNDGGKGNLEFQLFNQTGQNIDTYYLRSGELNQISVQHLPAGIYYLSRNTASGPSTIKFIKQ